MSAIGGETEAVLKFISELAPAIGIFTGIGVYLREKNKERKERENEKLAKEKERKDHEYSTYDSLDVQYMEYLRLCIRYPHLNLYYVEHENPPQLSSDDKIKQRALFEMLVSLLERAYLTYGDGEKTEKAEEQLSGWKQFIEEWTKRRIFKDLWNELGKQFDPGFVNYVNDLVDPGDLAVNETNR